MANQPPVDEPEADPLVLHWHCDPSPAAVGRMRRELGVALDRRGLSEDAHDVVVLVANELAANAVEHVGGPLEIVATVSAGSVRIEVNDGSPDTPQVQPHDPSALWGRGLLVVAGVASRWSWHANGDGKTVWAEVCTDQPDDQL